MPMLSDTFSSAWKKSPVVAMVSESSEMNHGLSLSTTSMPTSVVVFQLSDVSVTVK